MATSYNLNDNKFLKNRLAYHAASRVGIQVGQSLAQATNVDGHIVQAKDVWTASVDQFVKQTTDALKTSSDAIATNEDLVAEFKKGVIGDDIIKIEIGTEGVDGVIWRNKKYPAIELYENVKMKPDAFSSSATGGKYETYYVYDADGKRQQVFVPPTAVMDAGNPVPGYTARIQASKNGSSGWTDLKDLSFWDPSVGDWEFVYLSGMAIFHPSATPVGKSYPNLRITVFRYIGTVVDDVTGGLEDRFEELAQQHDKDIEDFRDEVRKDLAKVLDFKGTKQAIADLPAVKNYEFDANDILVKVNGEPIAADFVDSVVYPRVGDVWHVVADDGEYVYVEDTTELFTGEGDEKVVTGYTVIGRWEEFGTATDYSNFVTTDDADLAENKILVGSGTKKIVDSVYSAAAAVVAVDDSATADAAVLTNEKQVNATALAILAAIEAELCWKENMGE
jgi:phosphohistidine swiveling domain-containing protein